MDGQPRSQPPPRRFRRRAFLRGSAWGLAGGVAVGAGPGGAAAALTRSRVDDNPTDVTRTWLGPTYWGNRLQDWRLAGGRLECVAPASSSGARTVAVLTCDVVAGAAAASLSVRTGTLAGGRGFSGFLLGAGGGRLEPRAAALVQGASGTGGGLFCVYDSSGRVTFREHANEAAQLAYAEQPAVGRTGPAPPRTVGEDVQLELDLAPVTGGYDLTLTATRISDRSLLSRAARRRVPAATLVGGIALVSSTLGGATGARHWLRELQTGGAVVAVRTSRAVGPVLGTLYSLNGPILKLTAQLMPIGDTEPQEVVLQRRPASGGTWRVVATATVGPGWCAIFRVPDWDSTRSWQVRVGHALGAPRASFYGGTVAADPVGKGIVVVGMLNCSIHSFRPLDRSSTSVPRLAGESTLGLYTAKNLYFPYPEVARHLEQHAPDLYVAFGDQFYEHRPTVEDTSAAPTLDFLSKYYLWLWSFRELTRRRPTIVLVDDHDVFQGNLWGHGGAAAPDGDELRGGYSRDPAWVTMVQRCQCGHDPDPFDPTPVARGISVYYATFRYAGVSFAILEDRKFKTGDADGLAPGGAPYPESEAQLLGARQQSFLEAWATRDAGLPKVCLTQTLFGALQTDPEGRPFLDHDANGYPRDRRDDALRLLKQARAVVLSGDQHLASVVRHGIAGFDDGPLQLVGPALGTAWQRWFEPGPLPGSTGTPHTGRWTDAFGNRMSVLAVANPKVSYADYRAGYPGTGQGLGDRSLKREGYAIARVDKVGARFVLESWPWDVDPAAGGAPHAGWPVTVPFAAV